MSILLLSIILAVTAVALCVTGCVLRRNVEKEKRTTLSDVAFSVDGAMTAWSIYVNKFKTPTSEQLNQEVEVAELLGEYQTIMRLENFANPSKSASVEEIKTATALLKSLSSFLSPQTFSIRKYPMKGLGLATLVYKSYEVYVGHPSPG